MSQKDRNRQKRQQKRQEKHKQKRVAAQQRSHSTAPSFRQIAPIGFIEILEDLFAGEGALDASLRAELRAIGIGGASGPWPKLVLDLDAFLYAEMPWTWTIAELNKLCHEFRKEQRLDVFKRLFVLSMSNEAVLGDPALGGRWDLSSCSPDFRGTVGDPDDASAMALAFWAVRCALDCPGRQVKDELTEIRRRVREMTDDAKLAKAFEDALRATLPLVKPKRSSTRTKVSEPHIKCADDCDTLLRRLSPADFQSIWWRCGVDILREGLRRHVVDKGSEWLCAYPKVLERIMGVIHPALWSRSSHSENALQTVHFERHAQEWLELMHEYVRTDAMSFDERLRFDIDRLRLTLASANHSLEDSEIGTCIKAYTKAFNATYALITHGVPPEARHLTAVVEPILVDFFVEAAQSLDLRNTDLNLSLKLLAAHPDDYRLGCLLVSAAIHSREVAQLERVSSKVCSRHIHPALYVRCAEVWHGLPGSDRAKRLLYDSLDKEHKKQCLILFGAALFAQSASLAQLKDRMQALRAYFTPNAEIYTDLRSGAALESELIFLGSLFAKQQNIAVSILSLNQWQQFVGQMVKLSKDSPFVGELVVEFLRQGQDRWFQISDGIQRLVILIEHMPTDLLSRLGPICTQLAVRFTAEAADYPRLLSLLKQHWGWEPNQRQDAGRTSKKKRRSRRAATGRSGSF